jgi:hypothetical protein
MGPGGRAHEDGAGGEEDYERESGKDAVGGDGGTVGLEGVPDGREAVGGAPFGFSGAEGSVVSGDIVDAELGALTRLVAVGLSGGC